MELDEIAKKLDQIIDVLQKIFSNMEQSPKGIFESYNVSATSKLERLAFPEPYSSCIIMNKGPNAVYLGINNQGIRDAPLANGDDLPLDFESAKLKALAFKCAAGNTATIRVYAIR